MNGGTDSSVAIVGGGPAAVYTLAALLRWDVPIRITIFEAESVAGKGTPYHPKNTDNEMLCNISSVELPPVMERLHEWLAAQPDGYFESQGISRDDVSDTAYFPRLVLGDYYASQLLKLTEHAARSRHSVSVRTEHVVRDVLPHQGRSDVLYTAAGGDIRSETFDFVVIATGHRTETKMEDVNNERFIASPYPIGPLKNISGNDIGILGTSLSAVDAMVSVACQHGNFKRDGEHLVYIADGDAPPFHITMMSRKGLLPEIDFYHPIPHEPLTEFTDAAVEQLIANGPEMLLDRTFELFKRELACVGCDIDPRATIEQFSECYFSERLRDDQIEWAQRALARAKEDEAAGRTHPFKYAVLRMHEVFELVVPHLAEDKDIGHFNRLLKPLFIDNYAAVPHESIERVIALHAAERLSILRLGKDYDLKVLRDEVLITMQQGKRRFDTVIDATGQKLLGVDDLPFPVLGAAVREYCTTEAQRLQADTETIDTDDDLQILANTRFFDNIYLLATPFLLHEKPFAQGLVPLQEMSADVAASITREIAELCKQEA